MQSRKMWSGELAEQLPDGYQGSIFEEVFLEKWLSSKLPALAEHYAIEYEKLRLTPEALCLVLCLARDGGIPAFSPPPKEKWAPRRHPGDNAFLQFMLAFVTQKFAASERAAFQIIAGAGLSPGTPSRMKDYVGQMRGRSRRKVKIDSSDVPALPQFVADALQHKFGTRLNEAKKVLDGSRKKVGRPETTKKVRGPRRLKKPYLG